MTGPRRPHAEKVAIVEQCIADRWPIWEIYRTHHISYYWVHKYFPEYQGMTRSEVGRHAAMIRKITHPRWK